MDIYKVAGILYFLALLGGKLVYPQVRALTLMVLGAVVVILSLKARKSVEAEIPEEENHSWMIGFLFGAGIALTGLFGMLNVIF